MNRKFALSPLQGRLLLAMEEAGEESLAGLRAAMRADAAEFDAAVDGLERFGYVERGIDSSGSLAVSLTETGRAAVFQ